MINNPQFIGKYLKFGLFGTIILGSALLLFWGNPAWAVEETLPNIWPWWVWPFVLFALTSVLGVISVLAGIGGSVLFVPIVSGFLPSLNIDFVRSAGLMVALSGALSAGPRLILQNLASLRLAIPISLMASFASIFGALVGLALPPQMIQISLGIVIIGMSVLMIFSSTSAPAPSNKVDPLASFFQIEGKYYDEENKTWLKWYPRNMAISLVLFSLVGFMAGMFGLGAGWANVPVLNIIMGVPIKIAVATSYFLLAITDTSAAWIYLNHGALLPLIAIPAVLGIMLGAKIGTRILVFTKPKMIRRLVIGVLLLAGSRALLRGFGI